MLSCKNLNVLAPDGTTILEKSTINFEQGKLHALIGSSGSGKTSLIKGILGLLPSKGDRFFQTTNLSKSERVLQGNVGYVPQFSIVHENLTVRESLEYAIKLFSKSNDPKNTIEEILNIVNLVDHQNTLIKNLSGGQKRRISLALELSNNPSLLFCDEVTSGLDPESENYIISILRKLQEKGTTILCIIHNLNQLKKFDIITVVNKGVIIFQGSYNELLSTFQIKNPTSLYETLQGSRYNAVETEPPLNQEIIPIHQKPSLLGQLNILLKRRLTLFKRDKSYLLLTLAITVGFPMVVVLFSLKGLPAIETLSLDRNLTSLNNFKQELNIQLEQIKTSQLVTGLILFQVILLTLMGSNNGAREISQERTLLEKEKFTGLNVHSYIFSKLIFVLSLSLLQGIYMTFFVKYICKFPGSFLTQATSLSLVCASMGLLSLAFSALLSNPSKSSLLSIYFVGFQLPLSGVVLALPESLTWLLRPFIASYWGWAGFIISMKDTSFYDAFRQLNIEWIPSSSICILALFIHLIIAYILINCGCAKKQHI